MADPLNVPQFATPFRVQGGSVPCVEQGGQADLEQNVITTLSYQRGQREANPDFGVSEYALRQMGVDQRLLIAEITKWEPEATVAILDDVIEDTIETIDLEVGGG